MKALIALAVVIAVIALSFHYQEIDNKEKAAQINELLINGTCTKVKVRGWSSQYCEYNDVWYSISSNYGLDNPATSKNVSQSSISVVERDVVPAAAVFVALIKKK